MLDPPAFCKWLEQTSIASSVRESLWLFPIIETVHLLGMAALLATVGALDLRLLGWAFRRQRVTELSDRLRLWIWASFLVQFVSGGLLFSSEAVKMSTNPAFRAKMILIAMAGVHALIFHLAIYRDVDDWDDSMLLPVRARIAGLVSILLWIAVVAAGRFIGFV